MYKILNPIDLRTYYRSDSGEMLEIWVEGYELVGNIVVVLDPKSGRWENSLSGIRYNPVKIGKEIVGFNAVDILDQVDKEILRNSPEGRAYVEYNERIGGDNLGLNVPWGYPSRVQKYLDEGHTVEEIYRECLRKGISWEEMFSCYIDSSPDIMDSYVVEVFWD